MTNPDVTEARITKIRNLLNLAERGVDGEAESASAMATKLMIQWGIDHATLTDRTRLDDEDIICLKMTEMAGPKYYSHELTTIIVRVANAMGLQGLIGTGDNGGKVPWIIGFESDVERVRMLGASLVNQAILALATWVKSPQTKHIEQYMRGSQRFNNRRSYLAGFATTVATRVANLYKDEVEIANTGTPGTDLVLVDRAAQVENWMRSTMKVGSARPRRYIHGGASAGRVAGHKADIGQARVANQGNNAGALER